MRDGTQQHQPKVWAGTVTIDPDQVGHKGQITITPAATDFATAQPFPYRLRFKVIGSDSTPIWYPNKETYDIPVWQE